MGVPEPLWGGLGLNELEFLKDSFALTVYTWLSSVRSHRAGAWAGALKKLSLSDLVQVRQEWKLPASCHEEVGM